MVGDLDMICKILSFLESLIWNHSHVLLTAFQFQFCLFLYIYTQPFEIIVIY